MAYFGESIALFVAISWTATALFAEVASKRMGSLQLNVIRMVLSLVFLGGTLWIFNGSPLPAGADGRTWLWLTASGLVGYVFGDICLFSSYVLIGSRFGQLFMTMAPLTAALAGWILLGESLSVKALAGIFVTISGIAMSVFSKGGGEGHKRVELKIPIKGVLFGIGAGIGQGLGLVLSKIGMSCYEMALPDGPDSMGSMLPFAATFIRAIAGCSGFILIIVASRRVHTLMAAVKDRTAMKAALGATFTGPFLGVSLSLMAVQYTEAGIASTLMALTPVFIIWPAHVLFHNEVKPMEIVGAVISVIGASLFFI